MHPFFDAKENLAAAIGKHLHLLKVTRSSLIEDVRFSFLLNSYIIEKILGSI